MSVKFLLRIRKTIASQDYQGVGLFSQMVESSVKEDKMFSNNCNTVSTNRVRNHDTFLDRKLSFEGTLKQDRLHAFTVGYNVLNTGPQFQIDLSETSMQK